MKCFTARLSVLLVVLCAGVLPLQAQQLTHSFKDKTLQSHLGKATGLTMTDKGQVIVSSAYKGSLLIQEGDSLKLQQVTPGIKKNKKISDVSQFEDGRLVMVNRGSSQVFILDEAAQKIIMQFSRSGDDAGELNDPISVVLSVNNRIYIADRDNNRISVFNDQGLFLQQMGNHKRSSTDLFKPTHVAIDAEENIYVLESGDKNRVSIFDINGKLIQQLNTQEIARALGGSIDFSAMTADLNGILYLADDNSKQIFSYDWQQQKLLNKFGSLGQSRGQYRNIADLSVNNKGQLAVLDKVNDKVEVYQLDQTEYATPVKTDVLTFAATTTTSCRAQFAFKDNETLCIQANGKGISIVSAAGKVTGTFAQGIKKPTHLHVGSQMVAILEKNKLHTYDLSGESIFTIGRYGTSAGGFDGPSHVFSWKNLVYVADKGNNRVQIFSRDGQFVDQIKGGSKTFSSVGALAVDSAQNLYVAEQGSKPGIVVLDKTGQQVASLGYKTKSSQQAKKVLSLDIDKQDRVYALISSSTNKYNVRVYQQFEKFLEFGAGAKNGTEVFFKKPSVLSVSSTDKNSIYVTDTGQKQLFRFDYLEYPDAAFGLRVAANKKHIMLQWDSTRSPIIAEYEVQAAASEGGPFKKLLSTPKLEIDIDSSQLAGKPWIRVQSISAHGLRAKPSAARENRFYNLQKLFDAAKYQQAIQLADRLLKIAPDNADVLQLKADSQLNSGQQRVALSSYRQLEQYPDYKQLSIRQQVKAFYELGEYLEAKSLIDQVLAQQPQQAYPFLICTELSIELNDAIGAVSCAEDGLSLHPQHARLRFLLGKAYILAGIQDQGVAEYQQVIDTHPDNMQIRLEIADHLMQLKQFESALAHYQALDKNEELSAQARTGQAKALLQLNREDEAKAIAIELSGKKETQGDGYYVLGKIAARQQKYTEAVLRLTRASKLKAQNIDAWHSLAQAYVELNKLDKAVNSLQQGMKFNPQAFELFLLAGELELRQEHYPAANEYLGSASQLKSGSLSANRLYARSLYATRNYRRAAIFAEKAAKIAPKDIDVLTLQAGIASQQGKVGSAIEFLKTAISMQPASAELQLQLGRIYQQANLFDNSLTHLEKSAAINPSLAEPHVALGELFSKRRLFDKAISALEKAIELEPSEHNRALLNAAFADKKKSLEFKNNAPQLILSDLNLEQVFSAAYKKYADQSIGKVSLKNAGATDYGNLQLSFQIKEYMDFPVTQDIPLIKGHESKQFDFKVTFNNRILEVDEDIGVQVEVKLTYNRDGQKDSIQLTQPMTIYGKNAMVWGNANMVGSFVTPKDDSLRNYVRSVINQYQPNIGPLNDRLVSAMTLFSGLSAAGTRYIIDPNTPYTSLRDDQVDYVQFPRETLKLKSGDCDDLSVLLSAGLENLGIETALLEVPGHLLMMFNTGLEEQESGLISQDRSLLAIRNKQIWIPVESTMINASFNEAWAEGARKYHRAIKQKNLGVIDLKKAWQEYKPVTLRKATYSIDLPAKEPTQALIDSAQKQLLGKSINRLILPYQSMISSDPANIPARLQIAILYSRYGLYDDAQIVFDALHELAAQDSSVHSNQGNLYLLQGQFDAAIDSYNQAAKLDAEDGGIWVNLSMAKYRKGELKAAASDFETAIKLSPELKSSYAAYSKLLSQ